MLIFPAARRSKRTNKAVKELSKFGSMEKRAQQKKNSQPQAKQIQLHAKREENRGQSEVGTSVFSPCTRTLVPRCAKVARLQYVRKRICTLSSTIMLSPMERGHPGFLVLVVSRVFSRWVKIAQKIDNTVQPIRVRTLTSIHRGRPSGVQEHTRRPIDYSFLTMCSSHTIAVK